MSAQDEQNRPRLHASPRSLVARYLFALLATVAGLLVTLAIDEYGLSDEPMYAPLIGAAAVSAWVGGFGPAGLSIAVGWTCALWLLVEPQGELALGDTEDVTRWWVNLAATIVIAGVSAALRNRRERVADELLSTRASIGEIESLQQLSVALSAALSPSDVAGVVISHAHGIVGSQGAALGMVDGDQLTLAGAAGLASGAGVLSRSIALDESSLLAAAARGNPIARAERRRTIDAVYPESARLLPPTVRSAFAVPLRGGDGTPFGSIAFLFDHERGPTPETEGLGRIVADLASQALDRARLYAREVEARQALDRILEVAPRFLADDAGGVVESVCREARVTFGADYAVLWRIVEGGLELVSIDPPRPQLARGLHVPLHAFPRLQEALANLRTSFVPDVLETTHGAGLAFVQELGIRSSLRTPVVVAGRSELVLSISWQVVVSEPDPATIAVVRRFVDQAGLALAQLERRRAEDEALARAERLQIMTGRLSNALTSADVAQVVVSEIAAAFAPTALSLVSVSDGQATGPLSAYGGGENILAPLVELAEDTPGAVAVGTRRSVIVDEPESLRQFFRTAADEIAAIGHGTLFLVPLVAARRVNGLLVAAWDRPNALAAEDRVVVEALAGQAAQALDRASRYESEQAIAETLQRSVLPDSLPRVDGVQLAARYLPGSAQVDVGGDWFDALQLPDGQLALVVGDVVGKGVQAAASMAQLRNAIRAFSVDRLKPSSTLARLNRLSGNVLDTSFATLVYVALDPATGVCKLSSAGHPPPVVAFPDGRVELLENGRGLPLGTGMSSKYRQDTIELPAGSVLVLYTDGLIERRGCSIDDGLDALRAAVASAPTDPDRLLEHIIGQIIGARDREDDIAVLAARILPVAPRPLDLSVPSDVDSMSLVRDAMRVWLAGTTLERSEAEGVVLATWEALANAVEHATDPRTALVRVRAEIEDSRLRVVVDDTGGWRLPSPRDDRGFGLPLIEALVSSVDIARHKTGTRVTLEKTLAGRAVGPP